MNKKRDKFISKYCPIEKTIQSSLTGNKKLNILDFTFLRALEEIEKQAKEKVLNELKKFIEKADNNSILINNEWLKDFSNFILREDK